MIADWQTINSTSIACRAGVEALIRDFFPLLYFEMDRESREDHDRKKFSELLEEAAVSREREEELKKKIISVRI